MMPKSNPADPNEINVEDLLRLKRSEKPDSAFWDQFDRELHQRMLQTLVKKEPWYLQLWRGCSGRLPQATALATAALVATVLAVRPALLGTLQLSDRAAGTVLASTAQQDALTLADLPQEVTDAADYQIDAIFVSDALSVAQDAGYERDFGMDVIQVAVNDTADYSADSALARAAFGQTGMASLVF